MSRIHPAFRRVAALVLLAAGFVSLSSCSAPRVYYELRFVGIERAAPLEDGQFELVYTTPAETLYYSPGVDLDLGDEVVRLKVLRAYHRDEGAPAVRAHALRPYVQRVKLAVPAGRTLVLSDGHAERRLWPDRRMP
jgi:hypothetical protein